MNKDEREGQSMGRTTGATGKDAEKQQNRTIQGQESEPGKVWQESDRTAQGSTVGQGSYSGQGGAGGTGTEVGGGTGGMSSGGTPQGSYGSGGAGTSSTRGEADTEAVNEQMDESQWQGSRFSQGGSQGNNPGGSNG